MSDYKISKICPVCNKVFRSYKCKEQKTCSRTCKDWLHSFNMRNGKEKKCKTCGKKYYVSLSRLQTKFCSPECYVNRPWKYKSCPICHKKMHAARKTCSVACMAERYKTFLKGENNPNWKGGHFSRENSGTPAWLRQEVLFRDHQQCQRCGAKDWDQKPSLLHTHHIVEHQNGGETKLANLITLCFVCHWVGEHGYSLNQYMQEVASRTGCGG